MLIELLYGEKGGIDKKHSKFYTMENVTLLGMKPCPSSEERTHASLTHPLRGNRKRFSTPHFTGLLCQRAGGADPRFPVVSSNSPKSLRVSTCVTRVRPIRFVLW